jgi:uncharacterized membrane protein
VPEQPDFSVGEKSANPSPYAKEDLAPQDLRPLAGLSAVRLEHRIALKKALDDSRRELEQQLTATAQQRQFESAAHLLTSPAVRQAFDLSDERPETFEDRAALFTGSATGAVRGSVCDGGLWLRSGLRQFVGQSQRCWSEFSACV